MPDASSLAKEMQCKLLLYLDHRRYLEDMKERCYDFLDQFPVDKMSKFPPLRYLLNLDLIDLAEFSPELEEVCRKEPLIFQKMLNEILYACMLSTDNELNRLVEYPQVAVNIRLKCVPRLSKVNPRSYKGLITFDGFLLSVSKPESYVCHSVWSCPEDCEGNEVILQYIPKSPPKCYTCKSILFENSGFRRCGEKVIATFTLKDNLLAKSFVIVDDLIPKLILGSRYVWHAIVTKKITTVWSIEKVTPISAPISSPIPKDIEQLYHACGCVPWKFIYCLSSTVGVNICPLNCFMHLKISLLISLASVKANAISGSSIVHVLVGGFDTRYVGEIMVEAAKLADRSVILGTTNTTPSTTLIGGSGGVCLLPLPLHIYNHKQISTILTSIETGEVSTCAGTAKLKTAVWAQGMDFKKIVLFNVASVFGNVCRGDYGEYNEEIADHILQQTVEPAGESKEETKALKDVAKYLDLIAGLEVTLDGETENLLQRYFLAARKERQRAIYVSSMTALVATCLASARLCRRTVTNVDDAILAIWLHVSGSPEPRFAPDEYLQTPDDVKKLKKVINNFKDWLTQFTADHQV